MNYTQEEMETWKGMLTDHEKDELRKLLRLLDYNSKRQPTKITINFQHKRFSDNAGCATLNVPRSKGRWALMLATNNLKKTIEELLDIK